MKEKVIIIGYGWVGKAMFKLFPDADIFDPFIETKKLPVNNAIHFKEDIQDYDIAFVCVPTPSISDGILDTSIVEEVISWCNTPLIVLRSTVNPGTASRLSAKYKKKIIVQPEYLGETANHPFSDMKARPFIVIGGFSEDRRKLINLYTSVYNANVTIRQVTAYEAEVIKLTENRAIAFQVAQCQELYDVCTKANIDYYTIRDTVFGDDPRFNLWFTFIYPDSRGMKSKCIPKDVFAWKAWAESMSYNPKITKAILEKNKEWVQADETAISESDEYCADGDNFLPIT